MMNLLSYELLSAKIAEYKSNFELNKTLAVEQLIEAKQLKMLEIKDLSDFTAIQAKITEITELDTEIQAIKKETPDSIQPKQIFLFNGELFEGRKNVVGVVKNSRKDKFADGDLVKLSYKGIESETYRVSQIEGKNPVVINNLTNTPYSPSTLTLKFHTEQLGKPAPPNGHGMAGLSHPYWVKAN
ncbi:MAG: hypothetical protein UR43_C0033G0007 [candidate division TM6 bacterium GW2011_GWF2_33_332]|nr:MAG: hypothetical protein UR43_C0033G0007 [candidate division TM6 bacterium GW2011_GWF2_33_332]